MKNFVELDLIAPVQRALVDEKYVTPTPIQAQTIPAALDGSDVLGCAQTGTGKTAAFALPIVSKLGKRNLKAAKNHPFVLVLAPTRELAIQISDSFKTYGKHLHLRQALVYGGVSQVNQVRALNRGAHILVATPGRLLDLMNQGHIKLSRLEMFVLDEADQMMDMGFLPDLKRIISNLPNERQSLFFSATLSPKITALSNSLLRDPVCVNVTPKKKSLDNISQQVLHISRSGKQKLLQDVLKGDDVDRALVFTKTKRAANSLSEQLERSGIKATAIHGNKSQGARQRALESFKRRQVQVLVATDVAARGIDIDCITHVVNYDLPVEPEVYVHRIGRTGRAGEKGTALSFCCGAEHKELRSIERLIGQKIPVSPEFSKLEPEEKSAPRGGGRRGGGGGGYRGGSSRRSGSGGSGGASRKPTSRRSSGGSPSASDSGAKPRRRPRRKGQSSGKPAAKQSS